jgi:hypothetical protein
MDEIKISFDDYLSKKGFLGKDGTANVNALNALSALTTIPLVENICENVAEYDPKKKKYDLRTFEQIYWHLKELYEKDLEKEAVRFIKIICNLACVDISADVVIVLDSEKTRTEYLYEFIADYEEVLADYQIENGDIPLDEDEDGF